LSAPGRVAGAAGEALDALHGNISPEGWGKFSVKVSAGFFDPEFAPALRADLAVDQRAGIRLLEQRAIAALLIALWRILVLHRCLLHFRRGRLNWQQQGSGPCRAPCAVQKDDTPRQWACWYS
jgi:hypothetical protein